ncbi:restriction endonuclease [Escherichia coli]|nr:restriction endonuclease [Escherichia coli]
MDDREILEKEISSLIQPLDDGYLQLLVDIATILQRKVIVTVDNTPPFDEDFAHHFAGLLLVHHALSSEAFTKDKFEHAMVRVLNQCGFASNLAVRGNPGNDITVNGQPWSLKTQADKQLKMDSLHISKFMELGKGEWTASIDSLQGLRQRMFNHMENYEKIFSLRFKEVNNDNYYELIEIPKTLLLESEHGELSLCENSRQNPMPGYCTVYDENGDIKFKLYFDGGSERKLQIKHLKKELCYVRATWRFKRS